MRDILGRKKIGINRTFSYGQLYIPKIKAKSVTDMFFKKKNM